MMCYLNGFSGHSFKGGTVMRILRKDYFEKRCEKCKWNNMFWEESGCARFNAGETCKFEPKVGGDGEVKSH
jgi:hypothetical protein